MRARLTLPPIRTSCTCPRLSSGRGPGSPPSRRTSCPARGQPLPVQRDEYVRRKSRLLAEGFERVIDLRERYPALLEHHRNAAKLDVGRHGLQPVLQNRLEFAAMRAAVGKEFDDLDLLAGFDRLGILEPQVLVAFLRRGHLRHGGQRQASREIRPRAKSGGGSMCAAGAYSNSPWLVNVVGLPATTRVPRTYISEFDHRGIEAPFGELALHPAELVGIVVGAEPHAKTHCPCPAGSPTEWRPPSRQTRGAPSGFPRRPRSRTNPPAASSAPRLSLPCRVPMERARRASQRSCRAKRRDRRWHDRVYRARRSLPAPSAPPRPEGFCRNRSAVFPRCPRRSARPWQCPSTDLARNLPRGTRSEVRVALQQIERHAGGERQPHGDAEEDAEERPAEAGLARWAGAAPRVCDAWRTVVGAGSHCAGGSLSSADHI